MLEVGDKVEILTESGYTGVVLLADTGSREYLVDCCPGAIGGYVYVTLRDKKGKPSFYADWFYENKERKINVKILYGM